MVALAMLQQAAGSLATAVAEVLQHCFNSDHFCKEPAVSSSSIN